MAKSPARTLVPFTVRRRWRAEDARTVLACLKSSGLSVPQFAAREHLDPQRLYRWRAQLGPGGTSTPRFIEIKPAATCVFRRIWALVPATTRALNPEDPGARPGGSDPIGAKRRVRVRWLVERPR
jgi:hypothetical protein